mgnify:CR=1 FL=1
MLIVYQNSEADRRKKELESGFRLNQKDYTNKSRPVSRVERPTSSRFDESSARPKSNRKSWATTPDAFTIGKFSRK